MSKTPVRAGKRPAPGLVRTGLSWHRDHFREALWVLLSNIIVAALVALVLSLVH